VDSREHGGHERRSGAWQAVGVGLAVGAAGAFLARDLEVPSYVSYWGDAAPLVVAAAAAAAGLWLTRVRRLLAALVALLGLAWCLVAFTPLALTLSDGLVRRDPVSPADAVVVLASRLQEDGELTSVALSRLLHGVELVAQERAPRLVLTELPAPYQPYSVPARALLANLGVRAELLGVGPVERTRDEARQVAALFRARGWRKALLVTSPIHSRRAAAAFEREGLIVVSSPAVETRWDLETLSRPEERLAAFGAIVHERLGLLYYRFKGWAD